MKIAYVAFGILITLQALNTAQAKQINTNYLKNKKNVENRLSKECALLNSNYFGLADSNTCIKIQGGIFGEFLTGKDLESATFYPRGYGMGGGLSLNVTSLTKTDLGNFSTFTAIHTGYNHETRNANLTLSKAYIDYNNFRFGLDQSVFYSWTSGYGTVLTDNIINSSEANLATTLNFKKSFMNKISVVAGIEQYDDDKLQNDTLKNKSNLTLVGGIKFDANKFGVISAVSSFNPVKNIFANKLRYDKELNSNLSLWTMLGYKNDEKAILYTGFSGHYAAWFGGTLHLNRRADLNVQLSADSNQHTGAAISIPVTIKNKFILTPEVNITHISSSSNQTSKNALQLQLNLSQNF